MRRLLVIALAALISISAGGLKLTSEPAKISTGNIYYVAPTGSDANPGSLSQPW